VTTRAVFLSYRREETRRIAGRLADRLTDRLGSTQVFMDVDTIEPGADFAAAIAREVASCDVLIALIGPTWSTIGTNGHTSDAVPARGARARRLETYKRSIRQHASRL
jgi:TIR domain-containing protein